MQPRTPDADLSTQLDSIFTAVDTPQPFFAINPTPEVLRAVAKRHAATDAATTTRMLTTESDLNVATNDFICALRISDHLDADLAIRTTSWFEPPSRFPPLIIVDDETNVVLEDGHQDTSWVVSDTTPRTIEIVERFDSAFESATPYETTVPTSSELYATASEQLSPEFAGDLEYVLTHGDYLGGGDDVTDIGEVCMVLAARHNLKHHQVCRWSEDISLQSRASISRRKRTLEELQLIDYREIPKTKGRPPHELFVAESRLAGVSIEEFLSVFRQARRNVSNSG